MKIKDYSFPRGDTQLMSKIKLTIKDEEILGRGIELHMTVRKNEKDKAVIQKSIGNGIELGDDGYYHMTLEENDTKNLPKGDYIYSIVFRAGDYKKTIVEGTITLERSITE